MATKSSDLDDWMSGVNLQMVGHTPMSPRGQEGPEEMGASGRVPSHSPSRSLEISPSLDPPGTRYCLGIHMTLTDEIGAEPQPPHAWMTPLVEDMLCHGRTSLTEVVVTGPGKAVLFYGRWSQGVGLSLGEARDASFTLTRAGTWIGKLAYLAADPLTIREGWQAIAQAITECQIEVRGPGCPIWSLHSHSDSIIKVSPPGRASQRCQPTPSAITQ